jgi:hypothetical protein
MAALVQSEAQFQAAVADLAERLGWLVYHTHDSRRSNPGFPDLVLVRRDRLIFAELKTEKGKVKPAQAQWLDALRAATVNLIDPAAQALGVKAGVGVYVWRPGDWPEIERVLR